jgi:hypothetical protein
MICNDVKRGACVHRRWDENIRKFSLFDNSIHFHYRRALLSAAGSAGFVQASGAGLPAGPITVED